LKKSRCSTRTMWQLGKGKVLLGIFFKQ